MPDPFLETDTIRFGEEEAIRMHALGLGDAAKENLQALTHECHRGDHKECRSHEKEGTHECQCPCHR